MAKPKMKRGRVENLSYREYSCKDLLSLCDESSSNVPDVEIDLFCAETSVDDDWDDNESPIAKKLRVEDEKPEETISLPVETQSRTVPPNSPISHTAVREENSNPFVNYLLQIWSERKFNSPSIGTRQTDSESQIVFDNGAFVLEDPVFNSAQLDEEHVHETADNDEHIVPNFEDTPDDINIESDENFDSQGSRILNSCISADHTVPVSFLEE